LSRRKLGWPEAYLAITPALSGDFASRFVADVCMADANEDCSKTISTAALS
jgi:hypothetical protein